MTLPDVHRGAEQPRLQKTLSFGAVETIAPGPAAAAADWPQHAASAAVGGGGGGPLRRSPTPLVRSLAELAKEHQDQLRLVWHETDTAVPDPLFDSLEIESSLRELRAA